MQKQADNSSQIKEKNSQQEQQQTTLQQVDNSSQSKGEKRFLRVLSYVLAILIAFIGGYFSKYFIEDKSSNTASEIVKLIEKFGYVVDENGNLKQLTQSDYANVLVNGLLDEYSEFYTKEQYQQITRQRDGNNSGYGVTVYSGEEYPAIILGVYANSPAENSGLMSGDLIVSGKKDGKEYTFDNAKQLNEFLTGEEGQQISIIVKRNGQIIDQPFTLVKSQYQTCYIDYYDNQRRMTFRSGEDKEQLQIVEFEDQKMQQLDNDVALIKLAQFEGGVANQFQQALEYMSKKGRTKLILDLRDNGGGYMHILIDVASSLISNNGQKTLISYAKSKSGDEAFYMKKSKNNDFITKISVLANEYTASASECLIGAMLHYKEKFTASSLVIEKNDEGIAKTYGKGIMQTTYVMLDGSALKLTTAKIFAPDKQTCIHGIGFVASGDNATERGDSAVLRAVEVLKG